jgi:acyl-CoA hydrolase
MMTVQPIPMFMAVCVMPEHDALRRIVQSGRTIASGFATSEPSAFYDVLWDYIQNEGITDLDIRQALFMAPHRICVGDAMQSRGLFDGVAEQTSVGLLSGLARKANLITRKVEGLNRLAAHYAELRERRIHFTSPFIGAATNMIIPDNAMTRLAFPDLAGRNTTRMGVTDMQSVHFPEAVDPMGYPEGNPVIDAFVCVMTPPNEHGEMSHGPANGANGDIIDRILADANVDLLLYINPNYPFTHGYGDAPNTIHVDRFRALAAKGRLVVVEDESAVPGLPKNGLSNPSKVELAIAENVVNHMEMHAETTHGRAIQVGFGGTGVLAIRALKDSSWRGRSYTEMLEPYTLDLFESGKIEGSHFVELDGRRTQLDGKMVATFTIGEEGGDFYQRLHDNPAVVLAPASRVVISEAFHYGLGINNCLAVDFHGHVSSAGRYQNHHSGIGGGAQIWRGLARGGIGYLCLKSTFTGADGERHSSIMPFLPQGTPISHVGPDLMGGREGARFYLVTEHGVARLSGNSQSQFIRAIVSVAHPDFRDELRTAAWELFRATT